MIFFYQGVICPIVAVLRFYLCLIMLHFVLDFKEFSNTTMYGLGAEHNVVPDPSVYPQVSIRYISTPTL